DVRLRGIGLAPRVRVVDGAEIQSGIVDVHLDAVLLGSVDLIAQGARGGVRGTIYGHRLAVARGDHPAAFVGRILEGVGDEIVVEGLRDAHGRERTSRLRGSDGPPTQPWTNALGTALSMLPGRISSLSTHACCASLAMTWASVPASFGSRTF